MTMRSGCDHAIIDAATATRRLYNRREALRLGVGGSVAGVLLGGALPILTGCSSSTESSAPTDVTYLADDVPLGLDWDGPDVASPKINFALDQTYLRLVTYDLKPEGDGVLMPDFTKPVGDLAEAWENDGLVWRFKLKEGIRSAANNELTADDVVWSFARAKSVTGTSPIAWFLLNVASVFNADPVAEGAKPADKQLNGEVRKIDRYTVEIKQFEPNILLLPALTTCFLGIIDSKEMKKHATAKDPWAHDWMNNEGTAGFGPFFVDSWSKGQQLQLAENPHWKGVPPKPYVEAITMRKVPSSATRTSSLRSGSAQVSTNLTSRQYDTLQDSGGQAKIASVLGNESTMLNLNWKVKPFDNVTLRQAMAFAMPYDAIIKAGYFNQADQWKGVVPPSYPGYREVPLYSTDLDRARALLSKAGYPDGNGLEAFQDAFALSYVAERQDQLEPIALQIKTGLAEAGIDISLSPIPQAQFGSRQQVKHDLPFALNDQIKPIAPDAGYAVQLFFVSPEAGAVDNRDNYSNPKVDALWLKDAKPETNIDTRNEVLGQIQEILMNDVAWLSLVVWKTQIALSKGLTDYAYNSDNEVQFRYFKPANT